MIPPARAYDESIDWPTCQQQDEKVVSQTTWVCWRLVSSRNGDSLGAFPSIPEKWRLSFHSKIVEPFLPLQVIILFRRHLLPIFLSNPNNTISWRQQKRQEYLCSRQHLQFKQTMKELLEQEYSPYYVKSKTPSLLSHWTASL